MSTPPLPGLAALDAVLHQATQQLASLQDAAARTDVDMAGRTRLSLEMLLKGMKAAVAPLQQDERVPADLRARVVGFVAAVDGYERGSVRLGQHLIAIADGWQCPSCGCDVARTAALSGVGLGKGFVKLEVVCAECAARSAPTAKGRKVFEDAFGHLVTATWNPENNGFEWDHR